MPDKITRCDSPLTRKKLYARFQGRVRAPGGRWGPANRIEQLAATEPVQMLCRVLHVSPAGYYWWLGRAARPTLS